MSDSKKFRVIKPFDSAKGVLSVGSIVTFRTEKIAEHHLKFGFVEPASFEAPKRVKVEQSADYNVSEAVAMLEGMTIQEARAFASDDKRKGVQKALKEVVKAQSEKVKG